MNLIDSNTAAFWHRRINEITMLICGLVIFAWLATAWSAQSLAGMTMLGWAAVTTAIVSFIIATICYIWVPQKYISNSSLIAYVLMALTVVLVVLATGAVASPLIGLWLLALLFAGLFGLAWLMFMAAISTGFMIWLVQGSVPDTGDLLIYLIVFILPLVISYLLWHKRSSHEVEKDRAYNSLAAELSSVNNRSDIITTAIADGVIMIDGQRVIQLINPAAEQMLGWDKQDAVGLDLDAVLKLTDHHDQPLTEEAHVVHNALATNSTQRSDALTLTTRSGKKIIPSVLVSPLGSFEGCVIVFRDITEAKQEERQQAEFISTASHEMRTPVAAIEGYLGLALNPNTAAIDGRAQAYLAKAHESAQHLGRLFQDLLDVSKADDARMQNNPRVINVIDFTRDVVTGLMPQAQAKGLILLFKPDTNVHNNDYLTPIFYTRADPDHLREVLNNLVENAVKYTPQGNVVVDITGDVERVRISIKDTGIGIAKEDLKHLFQKFYRIDNSDTREIGGTGLGLYLCRRLVETMNGRLWVESEFHKGSTFFVELPRLSNDDAQQMIEAATDEAERLRAEQSRVAQVPASSAPAQATAAAPPIVLPAQPPSSPIISQGPPLAPIQDVITQPVAPAPPVNTPPVAAPSPQTQAQPQPAAQPPLRTMEPVHPPLSAPAPVVASQPSPAAYQQARSGRPGIIVPARR